MRVTTWNMNGIRARFGEVADLCRREQPDIVCLQELFSAGGAEEWTWTGDEPGAASANEPGPDGATTVWLTDYGELNTGSDDTYRLTRFDAAGAMTPFAVTTPGTYMFVDAQSLALDGDGASILFAGRSESPALWKVSAAGDVDWSTDLGELGIVDSSGCPVALSFLGSTPVAAAPDGSIYAALRGEIDTTSDPDFPSDRTVTVLARFAADGELRAVHLVDGEVADLAVGPDGTVGFSWTRTFQETLLAVASPQEL